MKGQAGAVPAQGIPEEPADPVAPLAEAPRSLTRYSIIPVSSSVVTNRLVGWEQVSRRDGVRRVLTWGAG